MSSTLDLSTPRLEIHLDKVFQNAEFIVKKLGVLGIKTVGITKGCAGDLSIAGAMISAGVAAIGDSHFQNIVKLKQGGVNFPFWMIRNPLSKQLSQIIENTEISFNSETSTIQRIADQNALSNSSHQVVIMVEVGDLREGIYPKDLGKFLNGLNTTARNSIAGIGATLGCLTHDQPARQHLELVTEAADMFKRHLGRPPQIVTLGGSCLIPLMLENPNLLRGVTHLRVGEAILLGMDGLGNQIDGLHQDAIELVAEVIEVHDHPKLGKDAREVAVGVGYQDMDAPDTQVTSILESKIIASTSDHTVLSCPSDMDVKVGAEVHFRLSYKAMLRAFISPYVEKCKIG
jgi:ornithine racemase